MKGKIGVYFNQTVKAAAIIAAIAIFSSTVHAEKINLNTADVKTIQYIPGVGESKAKRIVQARTQNGNFVDMSQIDAIKGFGKRTMIDVEKYGSVNSGVSELTPEMKSKRPARTLSKASTKAGGSAS